MFDGKSVIIQHNHSNNTKAQVKVTKKKQQLLR